MKQRQIPLGYLIRDGKAVVCMEEADQVRRIYAGYLSGLSMEKAAKEAGLTLQHLSVKRIMQNKRYLGDDFYPAIISQETFDAAETERVRREEVLGMRHHPHIERCSRVPPTSFRMAKIDHVFSDPYEQAQYIYSLIESEV